MDNSGISNEYLCQALYMLNGNGKELNPKCAIQLLEQSLANGNGIASILLVPIDLII